ncbi:MAG: hypothetical protein KDE47_29720 [Caldilineaceae bacterium]|nr:hypothetical protein [Caldilineaceae bacterium]MCB0185380.1 hypothetical protein [Caldilineaceae bacterium]HRW08222.1 hypothetical protein [Caldilineaceae bacterium]
MGRHNLTGQRLVAIFLIGLLALNFPLLSVFSTAGLLWGIPVLYVYLFGSWITLIIAMALTVGLRR